ncbi:hypothetical protein PMAYCL1PPCAC_00593 [Pristionchus mayeri]|uniref:Uncharacterized protein n=1 Tax=Pristionchus mayeri TaxID=1317129 RepID=A0AAN4YXQ7_9BILA|nr:hypothetical protein PMAYCL1PPCAC_00593 [Pristionchus mayeri]
MAAVLSGGRRSPADSVRHEVSFMFLPLPLEESIIECPSSKFDEHSTKTDRESHPPSLTCPSVRRGADTRKSPHPVDLGCNQCRKRGTRSGLVLHRRR